MARGRQGTDQAAGGRNAARASRGHPLSPQWQLERKPGVPGIRDPGERSAQHDPRALMLNRLPLDPRHEATDLAVTDVYVVGTRAFEQRGEHFVGRSLAEALLGKQRAAGSVDLQYQR